MIGVKMSSISLLVVSNLDIGSTIQGQVLLDRGGWIEKNPVGGGKVWHHSRSRKNFQKKMFDFFKDEKKPFTLFLCT